MAKQFDYVGCKFGAPMGRRGYGSANETSKVRVFKVNLDTQGYDDGGAYWGVNLPGSVLYCAEGEDYRRFVRALSRSEAIAKLGLESRRLLRREAL